MRTVYLGTSDFAVAVLERLAGGAHAPALVVTRPDRPKGRGRRLEAPPVADAAGALGLPVAQPERLEDAADAIAAVEPELLCVCAYGALVREPLLSAYPILNVHPSLLPRWRGAAPVERAIMAGDRETGVCVMRLVAELDAGPVGPRAVEPIRPNDDYGTLSSRLASVGGELLVRALDEAPVYEEQEGEVVYAEKISAGDRELRPGSESAVALERRVRALSPHIGAWVALPERLGVGAVRFSAEDVEPGRLAGVGGATVLGCAPGALELVTVTPPGRRAMAGADWLRGRPGGSSGE